MPLQQVYSFVLSGFLAKLDYRVHWPIEFGPAFEDGDLGNEEVLKHCTALLRHEFPCSDSRSTCKQTRSPPERELGSAFIHDFSARTKEAQPVAMISSTTTTVCPAAIASACISNSSCAIRIQPRVSHTQSAKSSQSAGRTIPYSFSNAACTHAPGSLPTLRTGTKAAPSLRAITGPRRNPRASSPTITSIFLLGEVGIT